MPTVCLFVRLSVCWPRILSAAPVSLDAARESVTLSALLPGQESCCRCPGWWAEPDPLREERVEGLRELGRWVSGDIQLSYCISNASLWPVWGSGGGWRREKLKDWAHCNAWIWMTNGISPSYDFDLHPASPDWDLFDPFALKKVLVSYKSQIISSANCPCVSLCTYILWINSLINRRRCLKGRGHACPETYAVSVLRLVKAD